MNLDSIGLKRSKHSMAFLSILLTGLKNIKFKYSSYYPLFNTHICFSDRNLKKKKYYNYDSIDKV